MAQVKKDDIQEAIVRAAKHVFLAKGFRDASLREIARRAGLNLSNLYTYYSDKDALFAAVLQPETDDLMRLSAYGKTRLPEGNEPFESLASRQEYTRRGLAYIDKHRRELDLLLNRSAGSSLSKLPEFIAKDYEETWALYFAHLKRLFPGRVFHKPSPFLLRSIAHFHITALREILQHDLPLDRMRDIYDEIIAFLWHGVMGLMGEKGPRKAGSKRPSSRP